MSQHSASEELPKEVLSSFLCVDLCQLVDLMCTCEHVHLWVEKQQTNDCSQVRTVSEMQESSHTSFIISGELIKYIYKLLNYSQLTSYFAAQ